MSGGLWQGRSVLVTGAGGFIGSHLCEELARRGARVRAFVRYNARGSRGWLDGSTAAIEYHAGDIRDAQTVNAAAAGCDTILHLAALIGIPYSYEAPQSYVRVNMEGTMNVLEAARACDTQRIVVTSTSEIYGTAQTVPITESHPHRPQSPYAATKLAADQLALTYHRSFALPVVIARPFNTFGPRQSPRAIIPTIAGQLLAGRRELRLGSLTPTRDLNFVADTVAGIIALGEAGDAVLGQEFNLGSGGEISVGDLATRLMKLIGTEARLVTEERRVRPEGSEVGRLVCDAGKALRLAAWKSTVSLDVGLSLTVDWLRAHPEQWRADDYAV